MFLWGPGQCVPKEQCIVKNKESQQGEALQGAECPVRQSNLMAKCA